MTDKIDNISDELLAVFLDGNTTTMETELVLEAIINNDEVREIIGIVGGFETYNSSGKMTDGGVQITPITIGGFGFLGVVKNIFHNNNPVAAVNTFDIEKQNMDIYMKNFEMETVGEIKNVESIYSHNYYEANKLYGLEAKNIDFDPNVYQYEPDTCAIRSQELVLRDYGKFITQDDLIKTASQQGWYSEGGTPFNTVGNLLDYHGIANHREYNANIFNIADELAQGHRVIVGVDANELEGNSFWETIKEFFFGENANHALIVSGIDTSDLNNIKVILTDPGTGKTLFECPQDRFIAAWNDSKCFMVATDRPAPLAYNGETMIAFDYDKGHIPSIGNIDFDQFHNEIVPNADRYLPYLNSLDEFIKNLEINIVSDWEHPELFNQLDNLTNSVHDEFVKMKMQELAGIRIEDEPDEPDEPDERPYDPDDMDESDISDIFYK